MKIGTECAITVGVGMGWRRKDHRRSRRRRITFTRIERQRVASGLALFAFGTARKEKEPNKSRNIIVRIEHCSCFAQHCPCFVHVLVRPPEWTSLVQSMCTKPYLHCVRPFFLFFPCRTFFPGDQRGMIQTKMAASPLRWNNKIVRIMIERLLLFKNHP